MSPITGTSTDFQNPEGRILDFQSATPLSPRASQLLEKVFAEGWLDPTKIHRASAELRNLVEESKESLASGLGVRKDELEFVGELGFGFWSAIAGALKDLETSFVYSAIDRQIVHAFAREQVARGLPVIELAASPLGEVNYSQAFDKPGSTVFWQSTNRETGIEQLEIRKSNNGSLIADMTASLEPKKLPSDWDIAIWDPRSFAGPEGLAVIAIRDGARWSSPIPAIGPKRLFGSFSKPLLLLSAIALEEHLENLETNKRVLKDNNALLREILSREIPEITVVGSANQGDPRFVALVIAGVIGEELLRNLEAKGVLIDAGSACSAGALSPSHVLSAMGYGIDGHIRLTLKGNQSESDLRELVRVLKEEIARTKSE